MPRLARLTARDFRNLRQVELELATRLTLLVGANGQGKTNLLEALYYLATGQTWRTAQPRDLIRWEQPALYVEGTLAEPGGLLQRGLDRLGRRSGSRRSLLPVVLFGPDDLRLAQGSPGDRRQFLDHAIAMLDGRYHRTLRLYQHVLLQRNQALKQPVGSGPDPAEPYAELLAEYGCYLWRARQRFLERLAPEAAAATAAVAATQALSLHLRPGGVQTTANAPSEFLAALHRCRAEERARATTLVGPHRDDVALYLDGREVTRFASQGQQRTVAIALRLGQYRVLTDVLGEPPLVLLDDLLSELDPQRRRRLLEFLATEPLQAVLADTQAQRYEGLPTTQYRVADGQIWREE